jgi:hypothetical protein
LPAQLRTDWADDFVIGAPMQKVMEREYAETKSVLVEIGLAK